MRRDTMEVLLCGGDWIKEAYGIRSAKEPWRVGRTDPTHILGWQAVGVCSHELLIVAKTPYVIVAMTCQTVA
ncbi:hypothetical protein LIER_16032 [Lithospermum erythrorhizon]|uniref:Uncharacterized protein n=1 Tax=Lithospermum erythrorhizon TaxID=34254 RepID=A0AAV3Q9S3_LITER